MNTVAFYTLGCKLNFSETSTISRKFREAGYTVRDFEEGADVYVINTCSVTDHADRKTKRVVKEGLKKNPFANVIVIGCYAQLKPEEISSIPGVNLVLGASEKFRILDYIKDLHSGCEPAIFNSHIKEAVTFNASYSIGDRTRSFLKVQDGCNYFCSFCTIPLARGRSRSSNIEAIVKSANEIAQTGVKEIVLTGVNIGDFHNDQNENFYDVVRALDEVGGIERFRISSIEPNLLSNDIIRFVASSRKFVPHFHIPLQSGSNRILALMRRRYERELYAERVALIKDLMPDACIGVDVIAGFPSETEEDFMETYDFIHSLPISYLHVFTYSERPDTTALRIKGRVPNVLRNERNTLLTGLSHKKRRLFYESQLGKELPVLWESENHDGYLHGFTDNYVKVKRPFSEEFINMLTPVVLDDIDGDGLVKTDVAEPALLD